MEAQPTFTRQDACSIPNMSSWHGTNRQSEPYLIQISWPLEWPKIENLHELSDPVDVIFDLTPPCDLYTAPRGPDGLPQPQSYGGADLFLEFISEDIHSFVFSKIFPNVSVHQSGIFGHSYGALFVLHALYKAPESFDAYLAASPSIWWNEEFILQEEQKFHDRKELYHKPIVWLSYGCLEQAPVRESHENEEQFLNRVHRSRERRMADNCDDMALRLLENKCVGSVKRRAYEDEYHGSVIAGALSGAIGWFLEKSAHA
ncbi:hypothetical protein N7456_000101 [Penicillium angulare]|uniref:Esterase n=1 Tax=Penicillium angulare TaxID=116970 RepID=A0A9W9GBE5_9EURO|nr:hypothetical protein N7456_000101 [Penicillium angulare]